MQLDQYLHERDLYYVCGALHRMSLALEPPYEMHIYDLKNHRTREAPFFRDQRKIIKTLADNNIIALLGTYNRYGKPTSLQKSVQFSFKRTEDDALREYFHSMMIKQQEAHFNYIAIHEKEKLELVYEDSYLYILTPLLKLKVNKKPIRSKSFPDIFFSYLVETVKGKVVTRATCPYPSSRGYDDVCYKAGFKGLTRKLFLPVIDKNNIKLLTEVETPLKNVQIITRQLLDLDYDPMVYENYLDGIE